MVTRKRLRSILTTLGLYVMAALLIGYFGVNAYSGNHGLKAKEDLDRQIARCRPISTASSSNGRSGSAAWRCCGPTGSTPICSTSRRAHCSIMWRPMS